MVSATSTAHVPPLTIFDYPGVARGAKMVTADFGLQKCCSEITGHITDTTSSSFFNSLMVSPHGCSYVSLFFL